MAANLIRLLCPNLKCRKVLAVPVGARGKAVRCRNCGMRVSVPAQPTSPTNEPAETTATTATTG